MNENEITVQEGKTNAIISYITWIGTLIAYLLNNSKKNEFANFHIRQMVGLSILSLVNSFLIARINTYLSFGVGIFLFVLWVIGFIGVLKGEYKKIPVLGEQFQEWFKNI